MITLEPNEQIFYVAKVHWFIFLMQALSFFFAAVAPLVFYILIQSLPLIGGVVSFLSGSFNALLTAGYLAYLVFLWIGYFVAWTVMYLDVWIVTNFRVIDVDQQGLFSRNIATLRYENLQDITIDTSGLIATLLSIGKIEIQTAGAMREFSFSNVYKPEQVKLAINTMHSRRLEDLNP